MMELALSFARKDRQRLHGLDGRTGKNRTLYIAPRSDDLALGIDDREGAAMTVFDPVAPDGFGENGIGVHR
jgi:hypothetical protein